MEEKLRSLKFKKAMLFANIESLSAVDDSLYLRLGKVEADILKTEKELLQKNQNTFDEN